MARPVEPVKETDAIVEKEVAKSHRFRIAMIIWIALFSSYIGYDKWRDGQRIDDIQAARVESCQRTYEGIREVFQPFFPVDKEGEFLPGTTEKQKADYHKFNNKIDELKSNCGKQTKVVEL